MVLQTEIKEKSAETIKACALRIVDAVRGVGFDVQSGGVLYDLIRGCGCSVEEISEHGRA